MSDATPPIDPTAPAAAPVPPPYGEAAPAYGAPMQTSPGPVGKVRGTGKCILLSIVTLGIYGIVWYYSVHEEMKRHSGQGIGGGLALVISFVFGLAMPYVTSSEVGGLYTRQGKPAPVSGQTGLWYFPGVFLLGIGPIVWFVKTNGALNDYWVSQGAAA